MFRAFRLLSLLSFLFPMVAHAVDPEPSFSSLYEIHQHYKVPGLGVASLKIKEGDRRFRSEVIGVRELGIGSELKPNDSFHLGSCTKSMTALLIAMAVQEGKFEYRTSLQELFPDYEIEPSLKSASLEQLLTHTSGIGGESVFNEIDDVGLLHEIFHERIKEVRARGLLTREILKVPALSEPGQEIEYGNPAYIILGHLLERTYRKSYSELLQERIFQPLQMTSCGLGPALKVFGHKDQISKFVPLQQDNPKVYGPAGRVHCSLEDWMKYAALHLDLHQGRSSLLNPEHVEFLYQPMNSDGYTRGGWVRLGSDENPVLYFEGSNTLNYAAILIALHHDRAVAAVSNAGGSVARDATQAALRIGTMLDP